eukprot:TRINITY_DN66835_c8_g11_i2.p1 TRINITY_DN66835_c8_g11~~TRINITY_DN66835_c8_g11_i2.p1  ORF type:complete len:746 (+),score=102.57 TRINITY_DN66835_c8_g11_i2:65-2302(+)
MSRILRTQLGFDVEDLLRPDWKDRPGEAVDQTNVAVSHVAKDGIGRAIGLQKGDLIRKWDDQPLISRADLEERVQKAAPSTAVQLQVVREESNGANNSLPQVINMKLVVPEPLSSARDSARTPTKLTNTAAASRIPPAEQTYGWTQPTTPTPSIQPTTSATAAAIAAGFGRPLQRTPSPTAVSAGALSPRGSLPPPPGVRIPQPLLMHPSPPLPLLATEMPPTISDPTVIQRPRSPVAGGSPRAIHLPQSVPRLHYGALHAYHVDPQEEAKAISWEDKGTGKRRPSHEPAPAEFVSAAARRVSKGVTSPQPGHAPPRRRQQSPHKVQDPARRQPTQYPGAPGAMYQRGTSPRMPTAPSPNLDDLIGSPQRHLSPTYHTPPPHMSDIALSSHGAGRSASSPVLTFDDRATTETPPSPSPQRSPHRGFGQMADEIPLSSTSTPGLDDLSQQAVSRGETPATTEGAQTLLEATEESVQDEIKQFNQLLESIDTAFPSAAGSSVSPTAHLRPVPVPLATEEEHARPDSPSKSTSTQSTDENINAPSLEALLDGMENVRSQLRAQRAVADNAMQVASNLLTNVREGEDKLDTLQAQLQQRYKSLVDEEHSAAIKATLENTITKLAQKEQENAQLRSSVERLKAQIALILQKNQATHAEKAKKEVAFQQLQAHNQKIARENDILWKISEHVVSNYHLALLKEALETDPEGARNLLENSVLPSLQVIPGSTVPELTTEPEQVPQTTNEPQAF